MSVGLVAAQFGAVKKGKEIMELMFFNTAIYLVLSIVMVIGAHYIANWRMSRHHPELASNPEKLWGASAFVIRRVGLYAGVLLGTFAVSQNIALAVIEEGAIYVAWEKDLLIDTALGLVSVYAFIFTALRSVDWLILSKVNNDLAIVENNYAIGITEGAILVATGFVAYGSLFGDGSMLSAWVFFLIGQLVFVLVGLLMEYVIHPQHNAKSDIEQGSIPSAIILSSMLLVIALFVKNAIAGDFSGYQSDIIYFLEMFGIQFGLFLVYMYLMESILLKLMKLNSTDLNGAMVRAVMQLMIAVSIVFNISL